MIRLYGILTGSPDQGPTLPGCLFIVAYVALLTCVFYHFW